jgi:hypothetical protein
MTSAPLALVVYNRPAHTRKTIEALKVNPEFAATPVYVFCDGSKSVAAEAQVAEARRTARELLPDATFVESEQNKGLARSIVAATSQLTQSHGRAIVLEDDLLVAPDFLAYMNAALNRYENDTAVMQVSAYLPATRQDWGNRAITLPFTTSWGWGTWRRAWADFEFRDEELRTIVADAGLSRAFDLDGRCRYSNMIEDQLKGRLDSWAVYWYAHVFLRRGLVIFPPASRVANAGFDGSGTHRSRRAQRSAKIVRPPTALPGPVSFPNTAAVDPAVFRQISIAAGRSTSLLNAVRNAALALPRLALRAIDGGDAYF